MSWIEPRRRGLGVVAAAVTVLAVACAETGDDDDAMLPADTAAGAAAGPLTIADAGFQTPESVLHDDLADLYLVSNINGDPLDRDDNGFISRVSPDGTVQDLKWIDGDADGVTLNAPKGLAILGDTLFVADIDTVRAFDRNSGAPLGARGVQGASFLNDLAVVDGVLYVTDSGFGPGFEPSGTDAIHRFDGEVAEALAEGADLAHPNGIAGTDQGLVMVPFGGAVVYRIGADGAASELATLPAGQLDGVVQVADGSLLVSSWEGAAVYRVREGLAPEAVVENVEAPADIGYDRQRGRVLIPLFQGNAVEIRPVR
ncbi:MAG: SMP-30/gluconolactonase/LRE family protein [Longimicrobiales bacterium]